jgi:hypothetical protein
MMHSPLPSAAICLGYVLFVLMGPRLMKNREPFQINNILIVYNLLMVILSGYLFIEVSKNYFVQIIQKKILNVFLIVSSCRLVVRLFVLMSAS